MKDEILDESIGSPDGEKVQRSASQIRAEKYRLFLIKPEQVTGVWESEDPNAAVTELLLEHLVVLSEERGRDLQFYSEFESRYEPGQELKWLSDYVV